MQFSHWHDFQHAVWKPKLSVTPCLTSPANWKRAYSESRSRHLDSPMGEALFRRIIPVETGAASTSAPVARQCRPCSTVFDEPTMDTNWPKRNDSVIPQQALALMNSSFVLECSERFAQRVLREFGRCVRSTAGTGLRTCLWPTSAKGGNPALPRILQQPQWRRDKGLDGGLSRFAQFKRIPLCRLTSPLKACRRRRMAGIGGCFRGDRCLASSVAGWRALP